MTTPELREVAVKKLKFDRENPRLPKHLHTVDEDIILDWMTRYGNIIDLMDSIGTTSYSNAEPVLGVPVEGEKGTYEIVEGNRRLAAVKLLLNPEQATYKRKAILRVAEDATFKPEKIPVLIYKERNDILSYLGYRHITGVKAWGPLEKATYLQQLFDSYQPSMTTEATFTHISKIVATKPYHARKTLATLALYEKAEDQSFWGIEGLEPDDIDFAVLGTAISYADIAEYLGLASPQAWKLEGLNEDNARNIFDWVFNKDSEGKTRVGESRNLKTLAHVIKVPDALKAFEDGRSLRDAAQYTPEAEENFRAFLEKAYEWLLESNSQLNRVQNFKVSDADILRDISRDARKMRLFIQDELDSNDE